MAPRRNKVDVYVGQRLRQSRVLAGFSQEDLGQRVGLTFQQVQKYEKGLNRIGAGRLYEFARVLEVPLGFFYDGYDDWARSEQPAIAPLKPPVDPQPGLGRDPMVSRESLEMMRAFNDIQAAETRERLLSLFKALAAEEQLETITATD